MAVWTSAHLSDAELSFQAGAILNSRRGYEGYFGILEPFHEPLTKGFCHYCRLLRGTKLSNTCLRYPGQTYILNNTNRLKLKLVVKFPQLMFELVTWDG